MIDPSGRYAYVVASSGVLEQYTINQTTGALVPMTPSSVAAVSAGGLAPIVVSGNINGRYYVYMLSSTKVRSNGNNQSLSPFSIGSTGALTPVTSLVLEHNGTAQIAVGGNYVYAVNFGYPFGNGGVSQYSINAATGVLTLIGNQTLPALYPSSLIFHPTGSYLYLTDASNPSHVWQYSISN